MKNNKKFILSSNLNLIPSNILWNNLISKHDIKILEMHELFDAYLKHDQNELINIYFFQKVEQDFLKRNKIDLYFSTLIKRLKNSNKKTYFLYSFYKKENIFSNIKLNSLSKKKLFLENYLIELSKKFNLFIPINIDKIFSEFGFDKIFDSRNYHVSKNILSLEGLRQLQGIVFRLLTKLKDKNAKLLVLDLDNTLWGGVVGEDGMEKLQLGQDGVGEAFIDFQKKIKKLKNDGLLLAIASKNNFADAMNVIQKHKSMILKKDDFVSFKINWNEKHKNIKEIAKELTLGIDSFVFWDDNPIERDKIRKFCPGVKVVEPPQDISDWSDHVENIDFLFKFSTTKEDKKKSKQYKLRSKFVDNLKKNLSNEENFLKSLFLKPKILDIQKYNIDRAVQLCEKTNQFNLTTKRYNHKDILNFKKSKKFICQLVSLKDIYGDHGIIGFYILTVNKRTASIDTFLMSCRILGRKVENWIMNTIIKDLKKKKFNTLYAKYLKTEKNQMCQNFYEDYGFKIITQNNTHKDYILNIKNTKFKNEKIF